MKHLPIAFLVAFAACAPARATVVGLPSAPADSAPAALPSSSAAANASTTPPAAGSATPEAAAGEVAMPDDTPLVVFESPYKTGARPVVSEPEQARQEEQRLSVWNRGGRDGKWHPEPRVVVDAVRVQGALTAAVVQREARKQAYGAIRKCYDAALQRNQQLKGKMRVQFNIRHSGSVGKPKTVGKPTLEDKDAVSCLSRSVASVSFPTSKKGDATVLLELTLNPGDLPVRASEDQPADPGPGRLDVHAAQAVVAAALGKPARDCYGKGMDRVPGLWGRLVLRADVAGDGSVRAVTETESTFPDPETSQCISQALARVAFPAPKGGELRLVVPIRLGTPGG